MATIQSLGVGSGLDLDSLVRQLVTAEREPTELRLARNEARFQSQLSALGSVKGALSALRDSSNALAGGSNLGGRTATSSEPEFFTATAAAGTATGNFSVEVVSLAAANKVTSGAFTDADATIGTGTLTLGVGDKSFSLVLEEGANSLTDIRNAINNAADNPGISASILNEDGGSRLILTARDTGAANTITASAGGGDGGLAALTGLTELTAAADAVIKVDTFQFSSPDNKVDGVIEGLTLDLVAAEPGTLTTVTIAEDRSATVAAVQSLVDRLNAVTGVNNRVASFNADSGQAGPLLGDATLRGVNSRIQQLLGSQVGASGDPFNSLPALGVRTNDAGLLELDVNALNTALDQRPNVLNEVLGGERGIATALGSYLDGVLGSSSLISNREDGLRSQLEGITAQRESLDVRIASLEARYVAQFSALDGLVAQLTQTGNFLDQALGNLPGPIQRGR
ncbi:flagellar cap protein [Kineobactrum sediminis]|uniref:Flagellar hook-associated protein 2 n=1 Tax=Kineobactrum sediminis TaxID=1905677 RepID=A0A2N5Y6I1_9GAMM|nr:flagellar filament capping protein FliD [Kineobactrum sediminis]PLW83981.1 flagellar cap protein [Kineobactrum sediminis]